MRIYTLESKNEVLSILTHNDNISYRDFKRMCLEVNEEAQNDYYVLKDMLTSEYGFELVDAVGGFEVSKKKGNL